MTKRKPPAAYIHDQLLPLAIPIADVELDPKNERKHDAANVASIKGSIRYFRVREPIGCVPIRDEDGQPTGRVRVIRGNGTLLAMRELAAEQATGMWDRDEAGNVVETGAQDWSMIPVLTFDDAEQVAAAYRVAHNRTSELGKWDWGALASTIRELSESFHWTELGYEQAELDLLTQADWSPPTLPDEPETPPAAAPSTEVQSDPAEAGILMLKLAGANADRMRQLADEAELSPIDLLLVWLGNADDEEAE